MFVLTNTVSADGSIGGVYSASMRLAEQSFEAGSKDGIEKITRSLKGLVGSNSEGTPAAADPNAAGQQKQQLKPNTAPNKNRQNKP